LFCWRGKRIGGDGWSFVAEKCRWASTFTTISDHHFSFDIPKNWVFAIGNVNVTTDSLGILRNIPVRVVAEQLYKLPIQLVCDVFYALHSGGKWQRVGNCQWRQTMAVNVSNLSM